MSVAGQKSALSIVQLGEVVGRQLDPLLLDETVEWEHELDWDFSRSAELVRHFTDSKALSGAAILDRGEVVGYGYAVIEGDKAVVGDIYLRPGWRTLEMEVRLFAVILDALMETPGIRRVESQLMLLDPAVGAELSRGRPIEVRERILMTIDAAPLGPFPTDKRFRMEGWADQHQDLAASVISYSYENHVDSRINEQYRSIPGARRFLNNIVQYPGCGTFEPRASLFAFDGKSGDAAGVVLASFVAPYTGHITQLGVMPWAQGMGLGRELLERAMDALYRNGAKRISLTVTAANERALELYRRVGFQELRRFAACMYENPVSARS